MEGLEAVTCLARANVHDTQVIHAVIVARAHTPPCLSVHIKPGSDPTVLFGRVSVFPAMFEGWNVALVLQN